MGKRYVGSHQLVGGCTVTVEPESYELDTYTEYVNHSPDGFQWGYRGSGPAQLAFALLMDLYDDEAFAHDNYMELKDELIAGLPDDDVVIHEREIRRVVE